MTLPTEAISAALLHLLWQGVLIGLALQLALIVLRHRGAPARYVASCLALAALTVTFVVTALTISGVDLASAALPTGAAAPRPHDVIGVPQAMLPIWIAPETPGARWLEQLQAWALPIWSVGVLLLSVRFALACGQVRAVGRLGQPADHGIVDSVASVAARMKVTRPVRVLLSNAAGGPSVVGWLRPLVLLPPAMVTGLSIEQLEAVIAHELAHITRHDYVVNLLQTLAETLFFYHPVTWWISARIRTEREVCCDEIAVACCGNRVGYARALIAVAKQQLAAPPAMALATTGGALGRRIQQLLDVPPRPYERARWPSALAIALALACVGLNVNWAHLFAQGEPAPRFEVASVKLNRLEGGHVSVSSTPEGRYTATGVSLALLIRMAYNVQEDQVVGAPAWADAERYDIVATAGSVAGISGPGRAARQQLMLRSLLEDRFGLAVHADVQQRPVYALVLAREGELGPGLHRVDVDCGALAATRSAQGQAAPKESPSALQDCGTSMAPGVLLARGQTMAQVAAAFSRLSNTGMSLNRPIVDRTGLTGSFDVNLRFTPDQIPDGPDGPFGRPDPDGPSIFTAVREQLGLKLDPQRGPVSVLVIDRAVHPTED